MSKRVPDEEKALFRAAVANARPLKQRTRARRPAPPAAVPAQSRAEQQAVLRESLAPASEELALSGADGFNYCRPGVQRSVLRKLARGQIRIDAELDLHGLTASAAKREVNAFLDQARNRRLRCVRIIHGKGLHSGANGPVLKQQLEIQLRRHADVLAFCSARPADGGSGAALVLLQITR